ncbi:MAG TPA: hypothetical protein VGD78_22820 [Chthoniobacterales bacterium]
MPETVITLVYLARGHDVPAAANNCIVHVMEVKQTRNTERQHAPGERLIRVMDWF